MSIKDFFLKDSGLLGNNRRIREYILPSNKRSHYPLVDDKFKTYKILNAAGLATPKVYFQISAMSEAKNFHSRLKDIDDFVVKPARGSMGNGIAIVEGMTWSEKKSETFFMTTRQDKLSYSAFFYYISSILSGLYSLNGQPDKALIQERLRVHSFFKDISYHGVPDIRVILYRGFPVMSMLRLPTQKSGGRGNLHQGAVGCGINLKTGVLTAAIQSNSYIEEHPNTQASLLGLQIPFWEETLKLASRCSKLAEINYLGVDIVIHPEKGPMVLEANARPGLSIQLANRKGLRPRLEAINAIDAAGMSDDDKIEFARTKLSPL